MAIKKSILELIGNTPLLELTNFEEKHGLNVKILAKLEFLNPSGSVKDRLALALIEEAEAKGLLKEGGTIIDATSGNTGISYAAIAAVKKLKFIPYLEEGVTVERSKIFEAYGLEQRTFDDIDELKGWQEKGLVVDDLIAGLHRIARENEGFYYPSQSKNPANVLAHYRTTGPEIWRDAEGKVDIFLALAGTAGTLVGVGKYLREQNPNVQIIGVQAHSQSRPGTSNFNGKIIDGTIPLGGDAPESQLPPILLDEAKNGFKLDEVFDVKAEEAYQAAKEVAETDGVLIGTSSAAALFAAKQIAKRSENAGKNIAIIFADDGLKYLSTELFKR